MFRESLGLSVAEFARRIEFDRTYVYRIETGSARNPSRGFKSQVALKFGLNARWLETGDGEMLLPKALHNLLRATEDVPEFPSFPLPELLWTLSDADLKVSVDFFARDLDEMPPPVKLICATLVMQLMKETMERKIKNEPPRPPPGRPQSKASH